MCAKVLISTRISRMPESVQHSARIIAVSEWCLSAIGLDCDNMFLGQFSADSEMK